MNRQIRITTLLIIGLFAFGLIGAMYDDPIEQVGIFSMLISGIGTVYLITKLTKGMKVANRTFLIMASLICLLTVSRVLRLPVPFSLFLSLICLLGFIGVLVNSSIKIKNIKEIDKSNSYLILAAITVILFLIDYGFNFGIFSNNILRIAIFLCLLGTGGWILRNSNTSAQNYPATLLIFIYAIFNIIAFVEFRIAELL